MKWKAVKVTELANLLSLFTVSSTLLCLWYACIFCGVCDMHAYFVIVSQTQTPFFVCLVFPNLEVTKWILVSLIVYKHSPSYHLLFTLSIILIIVYKHSPSYHLLFINTLNHIICLQTLSIISFIVYKHSPSYHLLFTNTLHHITDCLQTLSYHIIYCLQTLSIISFIVYKHSPSYHLLFTNTLHHIFIVYKHSPSYQLLFTNTLHQILKQSQLKI